MRYVTIPNLDLGCQTTLNIAAIESISVVDYGAPGIRRATAIKTLSGNVIYAVVPPSELKPMIDAAREAQ